MMPRFKAGWFSSNCNLLMFFQLNSRDKSQLSAFNSWHYKSTMTFFLLRTNARELPRGLCREAVRWFSFTPCLALWRSRTWEAAFIARSMTKPHRAPGGALPRLCRQSRAKLQALHFTRCHRTAQCFSRQQHLSYFLPGQQRKAPTRGYCASTPLGLCLAVEHLRASVHRPPLDISRYKSPDFLIYRG